MELKIMKKELLGAVEIERSIKDLKDKKLAELCRKTVSVIRQMNSGSLSYVTERGRQCMLIETGREQIRVQFIKGEGGWYRIRGVTVKNKIETGGKV